MFDSSLHSENNSSGISKLSFPLHQLISDKCGESFLLTNVIELLNILKANHDKGNQESFSQVCV